MDVLRWRAISNSSSRRQNTVIGVFFFCFIVLHMVSESHLLIEFQRRGQVITKEDVVKTSLLAEGNQTLEINNENVSTNTTPATQPLEVNNENAWLKQLTREEKMFLFLQSQPVNLTFDNPPWIWLIHVGKAGGSSLYPRLFPTGTSRRGTCYMNLLRNQTYGDCVKRSLPLKIHHHMFNKYHVGSPVIPVEEVRWLKQNTNMLLFTVRLPTARVVSAFNFHYSALIATNSTNGMVFYECFEDVESLAVSFSDQAHWNNLSPLCRKQGEGFLRGKIFRPGRHMFWNYQAYINNVWKPGKIIGTLRVEHKEEDLRALEARLGGSPKDVVEDKKREDHASYRKQGGLSASGKVSICCMIFDEMAYFSKLVLLSVNVEHEDKLQYLRQNMDDCAIDPDADVEHFNWRVWYEEHCPKIPPPSGLIELKQ